MGPQGTGMGVLRGEAGEPRGQMPVGTSRAGQATAQTGDYWLFCLNHACTASLFSFTHLMLALVFSRACSRARVAEPKPVSMLFFLNCSNCRGKGSESQPRPVCGSEQRGPVLALPPPWGQVLIGSRAKK